MRLFVFNPWHDEALAADTPYYTPTRAASLIEEREREVMRRWMHGGDILLSSWDECIEWERVEAIEPWGWDKLLHRRLLRMNAPERLLPGIEYLNQLRTLSSRATACELLRRVRSIVPATIGEARMCHTIGEASDVVSDYGDAVLKAPWSCSGRGVFRSQPPLAGSEYNRAQKVLREQGSIAIERYIADGRDFAMLFDYRDGHAYYAGLSVFNTSANGKYLGNVAGSHDELLAYLSPPLNVFCAVRDAVVAVLPQLLGTSYDGPLGVDMLLSPEGIHPAVEINLRRTMGMRVPGNLNIDH